MTASKRYLKRIKSLIASLVILSLIVMPLAAFAEEEVEVDIVDGHADDASGNAIYSVDVTHEEGEVGEELDFEVDIEVLDYPTAGSNGDNPHHHLDKVDITFSEGMKLVETEDDDNNDTTIQYKVYDQYDVESNKQWNISYNNPEPEEELTTISLKAATESDRLSLYERLVIFFKAVMSNAENEMTFEAERAPGNNQAQASGQYYKLDYEQSSVNGGPQGEPEDPEPEDPEPEDPEPEDPEPEDPEPEDPEPEDPEAEDPEPDEPETDDPEIVLTGAPVVPVESVEPDEGAEETEAPAEEAETDEESEEVEFLVAAETPQVNPGETGAPVVTEVSAVNLWNLLYLLLLVPVLLWFLLARLVLVRVPGKDGEYETVARKLANRKEKRWFVNVEKELDKHLQKYNEVLIDFRGGLIKEADKAVYSGDTVLGKGDVRYALVNRSRSVSWIEKLQNKLEKEAV